MRRRAWPVDHVHGRLPLEAAARIGRVVGPPGERIAWLDTETTGLAGGTGTYVFLVGIGQFDDGEFVVTHYFLRDLGGEREMLEAVLEGLAPCDALVTFNGARFDLPLLQTRFLLSRLRCDLEARHHLDLMTLARRLWHRRLGGYSLALLEQRILQVDRVDDVAGWMIPSLYVQYLQTGDPEVVEPVFAHNAADLLSLLSLHGMAGEVLTQPQRIPAAVDWAGLGALLDARGEPGKAADCYRRALLDEDQPAPRRRVVTALARHYRRTGRLGDLLDLWEGELQAGRLPRWLVLERLAMIWEWELGDASRALLHTEQALAHLDGAAPARPRLLHRRARLLRKGGA
ncbi:MAG: tetratricopeptide repeat protein [Armatimonadota bacterium]|nr:tetratricopeptide repeat protein [Armatimonadota bacterium]MDR7452120.1 tetratricopeptide repeat protein [Armatimonadota bacterium]MDR7467844.1 tetratricopeptide repeat protein [Armatimonadota bacterium]MDR7494732.1 tetratricopeptide repeat protein [Armatimonadota bacterium]MDR7499557.1 tetratricopeptide repeat protein [Armatimonadota bacterium]